MRLIVVAVAAALVAAAPAAAQPPRKPVRVQLLGINDFHGHLEPTTPGRVRPDGPRVGPGRRRRRRVPRARRAAAAPQQPADARRLRGRSDRRQPAAVGAVPRRADDRGDEPDRARHQRRRQPRARRGRQRAAPHAVRRLPSRRGLHRRRRLRRRALLVPGRERRQPPHRPADLRALRHQDLQEDPDRLHRPHRSKARRTSSRPTCPRRCGSPTRRRRSTATPASCSAAMACARSWCCCTKGGVVAGRSRPSGCRGLSGPVRDIVERSTDAVDVFLTGHTHNAYNCVLDRRRVTSAGLVRPHDHPHRAEAEPPHPRRHARAGGEPDRLPGPVQRARHPSR